MTLSQQIDQLLLEHIGYEHFNPDLSTIRHALNHWQLFEFNSKCKIVTIAGTNGKGETTRTLGHLLQESNKSYAQWTSPHIFNVNERMVFDGHPIDEEKLLETISGLMAQIKTLPFALSYYEFLFVVFLKLVQEKAPDYLLLEVGLGGRLDAVNVLNANTVLLTSIGRDHQEFLGNRLEQILMEKLGVTRPHGKLLSALELKYLRQITQSFCDKNYIEWFDLFENNPNSSNKSQKFSLSFSNRNQQLAIKAYVALTGESIAPQIKANNRNQFEWSNEGVRYLGFGSHNPDGLRKLVQFLYQENYNNFDTLVVSFSKRKLEDIQSMLKMLIGLRANNIYLVGFNHPKAMDVDSLKKQASAFEQVEFVDDIPKLIQKISNTTQDHNVLVCGSYYFLGQFRSYFPSVGEK